MFYHSGLSVKTTHDDGGKLAQRRCSGDGASGVEDEFENGDCDGPSGQRSRGLKYEHGDDLNDDVECGVSDDGKDPLRGELQDV